MQSYYLLALISNIFRRNFRTVLCGFSVHLVGEVFEEVVVKYFADFIEEFSINVVASEYVVTRGVGTVDLVFKPFYGASLSFKFGFYHFSDVVVHIWMMFRCQKGFYSDKGTKKA